LSGGNQQKICIGKWLAADCEILIIDEPTVGVDVGAKEQIHELIWKLANEDGKSIILISSDMPEMVTLARRILVFRENKIVEELSNLDKYKGQYNEVSQLIGARLA
jgi:ribose transport system ATP-binding protein